jgi:hypothetical protein
LEEYNLEAGGITTLEAKGCDRASLARSLDELECIKINVEIHAQAGLSTE